METGSTTVATQHEEAINGHQQRGLSTNEVLSNFPKTNRVSSEDSDTREKRRRSVANSQCTQDTLRDLREWARQSAHPFGIRSLFDFRSWQFHRMAKPSEHRLLALAKSYFPVRSQVMVQVFDFGENRAERMEVTLANVQSAMAQKPDWARIRWIHAPLGMGLFHSSMEDLFFHGHVKGRPFTSGGREGWPFPETEMLTLHGQDYCSALHHVACLLKEDKDVTAKLNEQTFAYLGDEAGGLKQDVLWRTNHVKAEGGYWETVESDIPWELSQGTAIDMSGPGRAHRTIDMNREVQALTKDPFFKDAQLSRVPFRCFHRADGFLLTQSPSSGIDFLNTRFSERLLDTPEVLIRDPDVSAIAHIFDTLQDGTNTWPSKSVEWLLVYIITEVSMTPHNIREGFSVPSIIESYEKSIHRMKKQRYQPWKRNETVELVREFLACTDELSTLQMISAQKLDFLTRLQQDCRRFDEEDANRPEARGCQSDASKPTWSARAEIAVHSVKRAKDDYDRLLADLSNSLNSLFQLRSIEQNELAVISDSQNKAIFVFTGVTIVFLPLSFFTSYYGMNLQGIANTDKTEIYFWKVCGSIGLGLVLFTTFVAFRHKVRSLVLVKQRMGSHL
ncbi:hypothetical protein BJ875DRAFT_372475 [Amylocarpus encephaloides]|uniref:Uncharacterized protein n=1 Tax=Amylocarpus encephaloides TaxID=45428 RepID=A0A9P7YN41_9HELO|nr:hypothetical protein BJ875DRAFT_372475 [Amylocarpus encephaloides]